MGIHFNIRADLEWQGSLHQLPSWPVLVSVFLRLLTHPLPESCRSRGSMLELASLDQHLLRRMVWCTGRRVWGTMRGLDSTVTLEMMAKHTLCNTVLERMDSEFLVEII